MKDITIEPNITKTIGPAGIVVGYRVSVRAPDPITGRVTRTRRRFPPETSLEALRAYRDTRATVARAPEDESTGFTADARRYLALTKIRRMPSVKKRTGEIEHWITVFGDMPRAAITAPMINAALHDLRERYSGSSCNQFRTALMSLWTELDGRGEANPAKNADKFEETPITARGQSYDLLTRILDAIPDERGLNVNRRTLYREVWAEPATAVALRYGVSSTFLKRVCRSLDVPTPPPGYWAKVAAGKPVPPVPPLHRGVEGRSSDLLKSRARLEVLAWTGMDPSILGRMTTADFCLVKRQYTPPLRNKGMRPAARSPMPLPMELPQTIAAFERLVAVGAIDETPQPFCARSLYKTWQRGCRRVELELRKKYNLPQFRLPKIRLKDLRHSFGTFLYEQTGELNTVAEMLQHAPGSSITKRYALGAVAGVLRAKLQRAAAALPQRKSEATSGRWSHRGPKLVPLERKH